MDVDVLAADKNYHRNHHSRPHSKSSSKTFFSLWRHITSISELSFSEERFLLGCRGGGNGAIFPRRSSEAETHDSSAVAVDCFVIQEPSVEPGRREIRTIKCDCSVLMSCPHAGLRHQQRHACWSCALVRTPKRCNFCWTNGFRSPMGRLKL